MNVRLTTVSPDCHRFLIAVIASQCFPVRERYILAYREFPRIPWRTPPRRQPHPRQPGTCRADWPGNWAYAAAESSVPSSATGCHAQLAPRRLVPAPQHEELVGAGSLSVPEPFLMAGITVGLQVMLASATTAWNQSTAVPSLLLCRLPVQPTGFAEWPAAASSDEPDPIGPTQRNHGPAARPEQSAAAGCPA